MIKEDDSLQELIGLLNPNNLDCTQQIPNTQNYNNEEITSKLQKIAEHFNSTYPQTTVVLEMIGMRKYQFSLPLEIYSGMCRSIVQIQLDFICHKLTMHVQISEIYGRMQVQQKMLRLQLTRYMLRLNNNLKVGSFYTNPKYGYIGLNLTCLQDDKFRQTLISEQTYDQSFFPYLDSLIYTALHTTKFHFMRILFLINRIRIKDLPLYEEYMEQKKITQWRKIPSDAIELLSRIKTIVKGGMHVPFTAEQYKIYGPILAKSITQDQKCMTEIEISDDFTLDNLNNKINEGGFSNIYIKDLSFKKLVGDRTNKFQRTLVIKKDKNQPSSKIQNEQKILERLTQQNSEIKNEGDKYIAKTGCCPYIAQFYFVKDKKDLLLMERYFHYSLDYFKEKQQHIMSLSTRIFIAHSVAMGLRYIHSYEIVHMDIKPGNILISKNLVAKICDFGEAINLSEKGIKTSGKTLPYAAPEMILNKEITPAYDIFAFGTMLFELIFDRYPIDYNANNNKAYENKYIKNTYSVRYDEEYAQTIGPQVILKYLGRMCIQCIYYQKKQGLQPEPEKRPNIDKICLVLKDCLYYLDKVY